VHVLEAGQTILVPANMGNGQAPPSDALGPCGNIGCNGLGDVNYTLEKVTTFCRNDFAPNSPAGQEEIEREPFVIAICTGLRSRLPIGMTFSTADDPAHLTVVDIETPSLIAEWNSIHEEAEIIQVGDAITSVNGLSGSALDMQDQLLILSRSFEREDVILEVRPKNLNSFFSSAVRNQPPIFQASTPLQMTLHQGIDLQAADGDKMAVAEPTPSVASTAAPSVATSVPSMVTSILVEVTPLPFEATPLQVRTQNAPQPKRKADKLRLLK